MMRFEDMSEIRFDERVYSEYSTQLYFEAPSNEIFNLFPNRYSPEQVCQTEIKIEIAQHNPTDILVSVSPTRETPDGLEDYDWTDIDLDELQIRQLIKMSKRADNIVALTYSEFTQLLSNDVDERFELILDYEDFQIYEDNFTGKYYYLEAGENDASDFFEMECIACLHYDVNHDLKIPHEEAGFIMSQLFDCDCCGEAIDYDGIQYMWFKQKQQGC